MDSQNSDTNPKGWSDCVGVDCDTGRKMGCQTFCCRLLVRLDPDQCIYGKNGKSSNRFIEKSPDGYCVNLDRTTYLCRIWSERSRVCRGYDCNSDFLLQVAVRHKFKNLAELVKLSITAYIPKETYVKIPGIGG